MHTTLVPSGRICLDAAGFTSVDAVRRACALSYVDAISGYLGNRYGIGTEQLKIILDSGKFFSPNREGDSHEAYTWSSGPVREVDESRRIMDALGLDWTAVPTVDSAVDWNPSSVETRRCLDWFHQYVDHGLAVDFWGGGYGATAFGRELVAQSWWPTIEHGYDRDWPWWTWGGSGEVPGSAMKQWYGYPSGNDYSSIGVTVDESTVRSLVMVSSDAAPTPDWEPVSIPWCRNEASYGTHDWTFHCLEMCAVAWAVNPVGGASNWPNAWNAWLRSSQRFDAPPAGAPVYWDMLAGGQRLGHVAIQDWDPAYCWSIDIVRKGKVDRVPKDLVRTKWGGTYVGWTTDLEGVPLDLYPPLPPQEDDMYEDPDREMAAATNAVVNSLAAVLTTPQRYGADKPGLDWCIAGLYDWAQKHAAAQIADAVYKMLQPSSGGGGPTLDQITEAFKAVINDTRLQT